MSRRHVAWVVCSKCGMGYSGAFVRPGALCDDLSWNNGLGPACSGRVEEYVPPRRVEMGVTLTRFHKDGNVMGISTNCTAEAEFLHDAATTLADKIQAGEHEHDWEFQLEQWLPQIVEICCKLRGYKADVTEHRVIVAGEWLPADVVPAYAVRS